MKIIVTDHAKKWFKNEFMIREGYGVHFFGKTYGNTNMHHGFSTGMEVTEIPSKTLIENNIDGITFFFEDSDDWFIQGLDLQIDYDEHLDEPVYTYSVAK